MPLLTLDEAKDQLNITSDQHDVELGTFVDATVGAVEILSGRTVDPRSFTDDLRLRGDASFMLLHAPVISLTSVARVDGTQSWDVSSLHVTAASGEVTVLSGSAPRGFVTVTYEAGIQDDDLSASYKKAAAVIVAHLWRTQRGPGTVRAGGLDEVTVPGMGFAVPNAAAQLIGSPLPGIA